MNVVKFYRGLYCYTQKELADLTGLDQYRISRIEGGAKPTDEEWRAIAKGFGMKEKELRGEPCDNKIERYLRMRLAIGHDNGIPEDIIIDDLGITERALRKLVQKERTQNGALICHDYDDKGYYIAASTEEKQRFLRRHMATIRSLSRECKAFRDSIKQEGKSPCA